MKVRRRNALAVASLLRAWGGACGQPSVVQQGPGTIPSATFPAHQVPGGTPQPAALVSRAQANDAYSWAYAPETAQKAAQLGAILGGPFGGPASMGTGVLGFFYGAVTAEFKIAEEDARAQGQYQKETAKDMQLEAAIEQELDRQRAFEGQIAATTGSSDKEDEPETRMSRLSRLVTASAAAPGGIGRRKLANWMAGLTPGATLGRESWSAAMSTTKATAAPIQCILRRTEDGARRTR